MNKCILCDSTWSSLKLTIDWFKIVKCKQCGLVYLQNPLLPEKDKNTYNTYFQKSSMSEYNKQTTNSVMKALWYMNDQRLRWIRKIKPAGSVLDIGSGRGHFLYHASLFGYRVEGIEISSLAVQYCEQNYSIKTHHQNVENGLGNIGKFDVITLWHVLEHFSNPLQVLINLKSLIADNGIMFIEVPNINSLKFILSSKSKKWIGGNHPRHHRFFFSSKTLHLLLEKAGFEKVEIMTTAYQLPHQHKIQSLLKQGLKSLDLDSFVNVYARSTSI